MHTQERVLGGGALRIDQMQTMALIDRHYEALGTFMVVDKSSPMQALFTSIGKCGMDRDIG